MAIEAVQQETDEQIERPGTWYEGVFYPHFLTPEETRAEFEELAQKYFGISGEEFVRRLDTGEYDDIYDDPAHSEVMRLSFYADVIRPNPIRAAREAQQMAAEPQRVGQPVFVPVVAEEDDDEVEIPGLLSPEETWAEFDAMAQEHFGVGGQEFIAKLDAGDYDDIYDDLEHPELMHLALYARLFR